MRLKPAILSVLSRDDLKRLLDDLGIAEVDRRSVEAMRAALGRSHKARPEVILDYAGKEQVTEACRMLGVAANGRREELVKRLLGNGDEGRPDKGRRREGKMGDGLTEPRSRVRRAE
jgi:hypothetical protein